MKLVLSAARNRRGRGAFATRPLEGLRGERVQEVGGTRMFENEFEEDEPLRHFEMDEREVMRCPTSSRRGT